MLVKSKVSGLICKRPDKIAKILIKKGLAIEVVAAENQQIKEVKARKAPKAKAVKK